MKIPSDIPEGVYMISIAICREGLNGRIPVKMANTNRNKREGLDLGIIIINPNMAALEKLKIY